MSRKQNKSGFWERYAKRKLANGHHSKTRKDVHLLSAFEIAQIYKIRKKTFIKAGIAGALGVILLYVPYHLLGEDFFPKTRVDLPFLGEVPIEIEFLVFSVVLVVFEIWYLTFINIRAVCEMATACGSPDPEDPNYEISIRALIAVSLEKKQKELESIGINPFHGLSKWSVFIFQLLLKLKAAATNVLVKLVIKKGLGRYAFRLLVDLAGIPVYVFWNIWGSKRVLNEARVRIMAPPLIRKMVDIIHEKNQHDQELREGLYDTLQQIAVAKRSFHDNHFLLAKSFLDRFEIEVVKALEYNEVYLSSLKSYSKSTRDLLVYILLFGMLLDGDLSRKEMRIIEHLHQENLLPCSIEEVKSWKDDFYSGRGLENFFEVIQKNNP